MSPETPPEYSTDADRHPKHSIAAVARRTGLSQLVLRAWERRYDFVTPARTATGRRRYSDRDLETLVLLARLTADGHRIGDLAGMPLDALRALDREALATRAETTQPSAGPEPGAEALMADALTAVADMDGRRLEAVLERALVALSKPKLRKDLIVPLLVEIGRRWKEGDLRVAHEHMATSILLTFLAAMNARHSVTPGTPVLAVATPAGHQHELGALLAASHALEAGWDALYLGPNLPAEDIVAAVRQRGASALLLSLVYPGGDSRSAAELREIRRLAGPRLEILVGGRAAPSYGAVLDEIGARLFSTPEELETHLILK